MEQNTIENKQEGLSLSMEYRKYGIFCENRSCSFTYWRVLNQTQIESLRCPRCGFKCKLVMSEDLRC